MEARIHLLDPQTRSYLRSTQIIASLPQLALELVQNSLDAGASQVEVGVNTSEWECWVRDNGSGISKNGLEILSHGGRYGQHL
jgi:DNA mismatch repair protein MLH3